MTDRILSALRGRDPGAALDAAAEVMRAHWAYDDATAAEARHVIGRCADTKLHDLAYLDAIRRHGEPGLRVRFCVVAAAVAALVALAGVLTMRGRP